MQRQAVPTLRADKPLVGTGIEKVVAVDSGVTIVAKRSGVIDYCDASRIVVKVNDDELVPGEAGWSACDGATAIASTLEAICDSMMRIWPSMSVSSLGPRKEAVIEGSVFIAASTPAPTVFQ